MYLYWRGVALTVKMLSCTRRQCDDNKREESVAGMQRRLSEFAVSVEEKRKGEMGK